MKKLITWKVKKSNQEVLDFQKPCTRFGACYSRQNCAKRGRLVTSVAGIMASMAELFQVTELCSIRGAPTCKPDKRKWVTPTEAMIK